MTSLQKLILQCPKRQLLWDLVRSQLPVGAVRRSGLQSHRPGPETGPWLLCGLDRNQLTCPAPPPSHLPTHVAREWIFSLWQSQDIVGSWPLLRLGIENGMLMTPTKSSMGISERRIALIRMASPLPAWINFIQIRREYVNESAVCIHRQCKCDYLTCISGAQRPSRSIRAE